jgi:hypothetical protein
MRVHLLHYPPVWSASSAMAFGKLALFNRDGAAIYRNERDGDRLIDIAGARQALEIERNRK